MKNNNAFGTLELLMGMLIATAVFVMISPSLQGGTDIGQTSLKNPNQAAMQKANDLSTEIDKLRRSPIDLNGSLN